MVFAALYLKYNACIDNGSFFVFVCLLLFKFKSRNGNVNGWWCKMCRYSRIKHHVRTINNSRKPTFLHFLAFHKSISCIISIHLLSRYWNLYNFQLKNSVSCGKFLYLYASCFDYTRKINQDFKVLKACDLRMIYLYCVVITFIQWSRMMYGFIHVCLFNNRNVLLLQWILHQLIP